MLDHKKEEEDAAVRPSGGLVVTSFSSAGHLVPVLGMITVHIIYGTYCVLASGVLAAGADPLFLVYSVGIGTFLYLAPFAVCIERHMWPARVSAKLMAHLLLISLGGVTGYQVLILMGMQMTSPAITSAMSNLGPGLIFLIACCLRFEKFDAKCKYSAVKAIGTLMCLGGVIAMTLLQNSTSGASPSPSQAAVGAGPSQDWITGCIYLFSAVFIVSCVTILQASALVELPAPLSLTAITCFMGGLFTIPIQLLTKGKLDPGRYNISTALLATYVVLSSVVTSMCIAFQMWCIRHKGPVFISLFSPIGTVTSAVLSAVVLGKFLTPGSSAGVVVMIIGLYTFLWAKNREYPLPVLIDICREDDVEKNGTGNSSGLKKPLLN